ncbi:MAG: DNA polymerase III subunit delta, partial [Calditrichota bacterium]
VIKEVEDLDSDGQAGLEQYLQHPSDDTCLLLLTDHTRLQTRFLKKLKNHSLPISVRIPWMREMDDWLQYMLDQLEMTAAPEVRAQLIDLAGESLQQLNNELKKLHTYLPEKASVLTPDLLGEFVGSTRTHSVYELQDLLASRALDKILQHVFSLLEEGASVSYIVLITTDFFANVWMVKEMSRRGNTDSESNKTVFQGRNLVWKFKKFINRFSVQEIQRAFLLLEEADLVAKTTSALEAKNYLTVFFSELLARREEYIHE